MTVASVALVLLLGQVTSSVFDRSDTKHLLRELHGTKNDEEFADRLKVLEEMLRAHPRAFTKELIQFAADERDLVGMGWWILKLAASADRDGDRQVVNAAIEALDANDTAEVAKDVIRAVSVKRTGGGGPLQVRYAGIAGLVEIRDLTSVLTQLLLAEDLYGSGQGLWELTLYRQGTADIDQPEKRVLWAMHLAKAWEFRMRYGFEVDDTRRMLKSELEFAANHEANWVRQFVKLFIARHPDLIEELNSATLIRGGQE